MTPPVYLPMLAASGAGKLQGEWAAEPKLDGWRTIVTVDPSLPVGFEVRSRTGRFITTHVPELAGLADVGFRMVLDGESRSGSRAVCKSMLSRYDSRCIALQA